jgi:DNA (cytosine-5)-methyltransferase 1
MENNKSIKEYSELKRKYNNLVITRKELSRGDVRAFIGVKTWVNEIENISNNISTSLHTNALDESIKYFEKHDISSIKNEFIICKDKWLTNNVEFTYRGKIKPILTSPVPKIKEWKPDSLKMISLFSGAMGLDIGFMAAGFNLLLANDISKESYNTVTKNLPNTLFIHNDIQKIHSKELLSLAGLDIGEVDVLVGGPPCQPFSTAGKREGLNDPRASPLREFIRIINDIQPKMFVMEEVEGLLSSRLTHVPISERNNKKLKAEEESGSVFKVVLQMLESTKYKFNYWVLNSADFGSPQCRRRLIIIGSKQLFPKRPVQTHSEVQLTLPDGSKLEPWNTLWEATSDLQKNKQEYTKFSNTRSSYMKTIVPGGNWRHLPPECVKVALGGAYESGGGKMGYFRRLCWDEPSPTVVTSPAQNSTMLCHPYDNRPLSVEEYKRIQGFPEDWEIVGSTIQEKYKLIGDAVPVHLSYAIAKNVISILKDDTI